MKKIIFSLVFGIFFIQNIQAGDDIQIAKDHFNLVCINPLISEKNKRTKVYKAIKKGYAKQLRSLTNKVARFSQITYKHYMLRKYKIKEDKEASKEFLAMLEAVNDYFERTDANKNTKTKASAKDGFGSDEEDFDYSETEVNELTQKGDSQEDKYKTLFVNGMDDIIAIYHTKKTANHLWQIPFEFRNSVKLVVPNVVFGEYFNPSKRGRRYYLNINVFFFIVDSDGDARVMAKEISDFNWKRNFRFISSQSGKVIQDTITKFTGVDIKWYE